MTSTPAWLPAGRAVATLRAGHHWDAIRVRNPLAETVLDRLGGRTGAVIEDTWGRAMYWLVPAGTAAGWRVPDSVALGIACWVTVPGPLADGGIGWRVPAVGRRVLTDPDALAGALVGRGPTLTGLAVPGTPPPADPSPTRAGP